MKKPGANDRYVLVVDADPLARSRLADRLRQATATVLRAASSEEALALAEGVDLAAAITAPDLPSLPGHQLLQRLRVSHPACRLILLSAEHTPTATFDVVDPATSDGLNALVRKALEADRDHRDSPPPSLPRRVALRLLLIDDDVPRVHVFGKALQLAGAEARIAHATTLAEAELALETAAFDAACLSLELPDATELDALLRVQTLAPTLPMIVLAEQPNDALCVRAVQAGADDVILRRRTGGAQILRTIRHAVERARSEARMATMAFRDALTGLDNRLAFRRRIAEAALQARKDGTPFAVVLLDLDHFKAINDARGHDVGDALLVEVAGRLRAHLTPGDAAARLGGDEFALLLGDASDDDAVERRCAAIVEDLRRPVSLPGLDAKPTASLGVALHPRSGLDCDALLRAADVALYARKAEGRDGYRIYGRGLAVATMQRRALESLLHDAVSREAFDLFFQPQVDGNGRWTGAEALLRWRRADGTHIPASDFVGVLEETGLLAELSPWIFQRALEQFQQLLPLGVERLALNVSPKQFGATDVAALLIDLTGTLGVTPAQVEVEITETALLPSGTLIGDQLHRLGRAGFRIALDDFGTGYSSLVHLRHYPVSTLKVDGTFVGAMARDRTAHAIVEAVALLGQRLGLTVVAEGVETRQQAGTLLALGCDALQGYHLAPPMDVRAFARLARRPRAAAVHELVAVGPAAAEGARLRQTGD